MEKSVTMRLSSGGSSVDWAAEAETARQEEEERHWRLRRRCGKPIEDDDDDSDSGASTTASLCLRWWRCCCWCDGVPRAAADALRTEAPQSAAADKERALSIGER